MKGACKKLREAVSGVLDLPEKITDTQKYLGVILSMNGKVTAQVRQRLQVAKQIFALYANILTSKAPFVFRSLVFKATFVAVLLQSMETFVLTNVVIDQLEKFQVRYARKVLGAAGFLFEDGHITQRLSADTVRDKMKLFTVRSALSFRRLRWLRKVVLREIESSQPMMQLAILFGRFDWETQFPIADGVFSDSAPSMLRCLESDLGSIGFPFLIRLGERS